MMGSRQDMNDLSESTLAIIFHYLSCLASGRDYKSNCFL